MIALENVTYRYGDSAEPALHNVSLRIAPGESVCLMGRNGSGKSTLLKIIAGLLKPSRGRVTVDGHVPGDASAGNGRQSVGMLFQNADNQMVATLVEKELAFALENQATPPDAMERAVTKIAERFSLVHLRRRLTSGLSGGEKQRVALASIMIQNPPVLLLDEPDTFLDAAGQRVVRDELRQLHRELSGLSELRITQNPAIARDYARLIVLDRGEVIADHSPAEVFSRTDLLRQAGLLCEIPEADDIDQRTGAAASRAVARIAADGLTFGYPGQAAVLEDLSLSVRGGEAVALIGPTGAGKTSLGLLLCGIHRPVSGSIAYLDSTGAAIETSQRRGMVVTVLQQAERQFFLDTCAKEVAYGPSNLGRVLNDFEIDDYFRLVDLPPERFRKRDPFTLSGGEKRRLAFASALSMEPSMLIFDEPTAGLDPAGMGRFIGLSRRLRGQGRGQLVISHDGFLVRQVADRVLFLKNSRELVELRPDELGRRAEVAEILADHV